MKNFIHYLIVAICILPSCTGREGSCPVSTKKRFDHVVIIGIDGMSVQGLLKARTPCMDSLMNIGAYSYTMRGVLPTSSKPNWGTMLCGAGPDITGMTSNGWYRNTYDLHPVVMTENLTFPNIFRIIREQKPDTELGAIYDWGDFKSILDDDIMDMSATYPTALETAKKSAEYILEKKPDFLFVQLDEVDHYGHSAGHMSSRYIQSIEDADTHIQIIVNAIRKAGIADHTLIMVVSDHGGVFHSHGENMYEGVTTPIIFAGKGVKKNYLIQQQIYRYDVASTVAFALGVVAPQVWIGRPVYPAFKGFNEPANLWKGVEVLPPPVFCTDTYNPPHGDISVDKPVEVCINTPLGVEGEIRYTTDESMPTRESALYGGAFSLDQSAIVTVKLFNDHGESPRVRAHYRVADTKAGNGLQYAFYHCPEAREMPSFSTLKPVASGICYEFGIKTPELDALVKQYRNYFGITFTGWVQIDRDGVYTFNVSSGGAHRLYVNSKLIVYKYEMSGGAVSGRIELQKGMYPVRLEFFSKEGQNLDVNYESRGFPIRLLPADKLFVRKK